MEPCQCLCTVTHRGQPGICAGSAVTVRTYGPEITGMGRSVDVSLCRPCADAQGMP